MVTFSSLFHEDAAFVNVVGTYARGRQEIQRLHEAAHAGIFRNSTVAMRVEDTRSVIDAVLVSHVVSELRGDDRVPDRVRRAILTVVFELRDNEWKISTAHNTNIVPPSG